MERKMLEIQLDTQNHTFSPGDTIAGRIIVNLTKPKSLRSLGIITEGKAHVSWEETSGVGDDKSTRRYSATEPYFKMKAYMLGQPHGETMELQTGSYAFPFFFCLPHGIPGSFESRDGHIRYTIKAFIDRPWKLNHETKISFHVETPCISTQSPTPMHAVEGETIKTLCCCLCVNIGAIELDVYLPRQSFAIGETIEAKIIINSTSRSVDVTKIELQIEQVTVLHASGESDTNRKIWQKVKDERSFHKRDETVLKMQVPSVPYTKMDHCSIIDNDYYLNVVIFLSGWRCNVKKQYLIDIGVKPALNIEYENSNTTLTLRPSTDGYKELTSDPVGFSKPTSTMPMTYQLSHEGNLPQK